MRKLPKHYLFTYAHLSACHKLLYLPEAEPPPVHVMYKQWTVYVVMLAWHG